MAGNRALIVIDPQNDYFPRGAFALWNTEETLCNIERTIGAAIKANIPVLIVQHVADPELGLAPFFNAGTVGAEIHPRIHAAAPDAIIVTKTFADGFEKTDLESTLRRLDVDELLIAGMMTQNCVTHTAISKAAEKYKVSILPDCCTTVSEMLHLIALHAVSTRTALTPSATALTPTSN
jgi:nicotinamidase-related amidase